MTTSIKLFLGLSILVVFSTATEAASKTSSVTKCVDAAGNVTFTSMGCKTSETNETAASPSQAVEANIPTTTSTPQTKSSTETNSATTS